MACCLVVEIVTGKLPLRQREAYAGRGRKSKCKRPDSYTKRVLPSYFLTEIATPVEAASLALVSNLYIIRFVEKGTTEIAEHKRGMKALGYITFSRYCLRASAI